MFAELPTSIRRLASLVALATLAWTFVACGPSREMLNVEQVALLGGTEAGDFTQTVADGDALWEQRADRAKLEEAIATWEKAIAIESPDLDATQRREVVLELYTKIAHGYYFLSDGYVRFDADDPDDVAEPMMATYDKGVRAGEKALYLHSPEYQKAVVTDEKPRESVVELLGKEAIPAMYWYAANLGKWALLVGLAETLGHVDAIFAMISRIEKLQEDFFFHAALRYFGGYYTKLPFPGGDEEMSKSYFEKSIQGSPNYLGTRVLYAEMFAVNANDEALFDEQLEMVLATPDDVEPSLTPENIVEKRKAQRLLEAKDDHF